MAKLKRVESAARKRSDLAAKSTMKSKKKVNVPSQLRIYIYIHIYMCVYVHVYIYIYIYICRFIHVHVMQFHSTTVGCAGGLAVLALTPVTPETWPSATLAAQLSDALST